jgi:hypothetical protein
MRRVVLAVAVLAVCAVGAQAAFSPFTPGRYAGTSAQNFRVSFQAAGGNVTRFTYTARLPCSGGTALRSTNTLKTSQRISGAGRFSASRGSGSSSFRMSGRVSGTRATGTLSERDGTCNSGTIRWSARRTGPPKSGGGGGGGTLKCAPKGSFNGGDLQVDMSCGGAEFDAFFVFVPRLPHRAQSGTAQVSCTIAKYQPPGSTTTRDAVYCSGQNVRMKSGRVLITLGTAAGCADANSTDVTAGEIGKPISGPFKLASAAC